MLNGASGCERTIGGFIDAVQGTGWQISEVIPSSQGASGFLLAPA
jgi:hypothetical protein